MTPPKSLEKQIEAFIEEDIRFWIEAKHQEPQQEEIDFREESY